MTDEAARIGAEEEERDAEGGGEKEEREGEREGEGREEKKRKGGRRRSKYPDSNYSSLRPFVRYININYIYVGQSSGIIPFLPF